MTIPAKSDKRYIASTTSIGPLARDNAKLFEEFDNSLCPLMPAQNGDSRNRQKQHAIDHLTFIFAKSGLLPTKCLAIR